MKTSSLWFAGSLSLACLVPVACGDDTGAGGSGGSGGATTASTSTGMQPVTTATSASTGMPMCSGAAFAMGPDCSSCLEGACCSELEDSAGTYSAELGQCATDNCGNECFAFPTAPECNAPTTLPAAGACANPAVSQCNPVTQQGCDVGAGEACDIGDSGFVCYSDGNVHALCEDCGQNSEFCEPGYFCSGQCIKYCCENADCGEGTCIKGVFLFDQNVGLCQDRGMGQGGGGQGGMGQGGGGQGGMGQGGGGQGGGGQGGMGQGGGT